MKRNPDVDAWFEAYANPHKAVVERVREVILDADPRIIESVKWSTPTFSYRGNLVSVQPRAAKFVSLFEHGADDLRAVVRAWCDVRDSGAVPGS
ncbi:MAG: DUF1801 domain-containing protein [Chloroflexota bacterium]